MDSVVERIEKICKLLRINIPIVQGAMANISNYKLAGSVSECGGLGVIAAGGMSAKELEDEIDAIRLITKNNFAVNVALKSDNLEEIIQLLDKEEVPIVITGAGNPERYIERWKTSGKIVIPVVASVALAKRLARFGADAIIAEGSESGGHIGTTTTMCLIPQIADAVEIPVIAAGGICDARGMAAAYMLGASAVQMGTRFLVSKESPANKVYKDMVLGAKDISTVVLNRTQNNKDDIRALKSSLTNEYLKLEAEGNLVIEGMLKNALKYAAEDGDKEKGIFMAGQCAGMIREEKSVLEILQEVWGDAQKYLQMR